MISKDGGGGGEDNFRFNTVYRPLRLTELPIASHLCPGDRGELQPGVQHGGGGGPHAGHPPLRHRP